MADNLEHAIGQAQAPVSLASGPPLTVANDEACDHHNAASRELITGKGALYNESLDPGRTLTDLHATGKNPKITRDILQGESTLGKVEKETDISGVALPVEKNTLKGLPPGRKNILMLCFCLSMFSECPPPSPKIMQNSSADTYIS